jgi:hypothetical protein
VTASFATDLLYGLVAFVVVLAALALWRVKWHDPRVHRIRLGVFFERDRELDDDYEEDETTQHRYPRKEEP